MSAAVPFNGKSCAAVELVKLTQGFKLVAIGLQKPRVKRSLNRFLHGVFFFLF